MAHATEMNASAPRPDHFRLQMEGLAIAVLYVVFFFWIHLGSGSERVDTRLLAVFFSGLIVIPLLVGMPLVLLRRVISGALPAHSSAAALLPFARLALYGLMSLFVWVVTREAYAWIFERVLE